MSFSKNDTTLSTHEIQKGPSITEEQTSSTEYNAQSNNSIDPNSGVKRGLKDRHLSMMALAGIIGPGLLVGAGGALANGGPLALLLGFAIIGILAFSVTQSLGELTTLYPTGGAFMVRSTSLFVYCVYVTTNPLFFIDAFRAIWRQGFKLRSWIFLCVRVVCRHC